ncbi:MAG: hypothetical protein ACLFVU_13850 [Phycisphaerae bacterium]
MKTNENNFEEDIAVDEYIDLNEIDRLGRLRIWRPLRDLPADGDDFEPRGVNTRWDWVRA